MASTAALAIKFDLATRRLNAAMEALAAEKGVPVPPPIGKTQTAEERRAYETERMANFLESIVNTPVLEKP